MKILHQRRKTNISPSRSWIQYTKRQPCAPMYGRLYHYAGNNPVRYIDPDGRTARNASNQYVVIRLESADDTTGAHYMILAPGDFSKANCDGFIFSSSNIGKVSANDEWGDVVNFTILGDSFLGVIAYPDDLKSFWTNESRDVIKIGVNCSILLNNIVHSFTDKKYISFKYFSGSYCMQSRDGQPLNDWWQDIASRDKENFGSTQAEWKEKYENDPIQKQLQKKYLQKEDCL